MEAVWPGFSSLSHLGKVVPSLKGTKGILKSFLHRAPEEKQNLFRQSALVMEGYCGAVRALGREGRRQEWNMREDRWKDLRFWWCVVLRVFGCTADPWVASRSTSSQQRSCLPPAVPCLWSLQQCAVVSRLCSVMGCGLGEDYSPRKLVGTAVGSPGHGTSLCDVSTRSWDPSCHPCWLQAPETDLATEVGKGLQLCKSG